MEHIAAIDIGSNALRLAVARLQGGEYQICYRSREPVRLGTDVFDTGQIGPKSQQNLTAALLNFRNQMENHNVQRYRGIATSAMREASNQLEVVQFLKESTGLKIEVIDGQEEAQLVFQSISQKIDLQSSPHLLIDIGGGSVELVAIDMGQILKKESFPLGTVRTLNLHRQQKLESHKGDKLLLSDWLLDHLDKVMGSFFRDLPPFNTAVGSGGNMDRFAKIREFQTDQNILSLSMNEVTQLSKEICRCKLKERISRFRIRQDRADVIEPAILITKKIMSMGGCLKIELPQVGIKEGVLAQLS